MADGQDALGTLVETAEPTAVETPEVVEAGAGIPESDLPDTQATEQPEVQEQKPEPTKTELSAKEIAKTLRELREQHPDKADLLRRVNDAFFKSDRYSNIYATPEEAQRAKVTFEALGGEEGLANLQQSAEQIRQLDEMAAQGSPEMVDRWIKQAPEGFKKAAPVMLDSLEKLDGRSYQDTLRPHLTRAIFGAGLPDAIERISHYAANPTGMNAELLKREITSLTQWIGQLNEQEQRRQQSANDPRIKEFQTREQDLAKQQSTIRQQQIGGEVEPYLRSTIDSALAEKSKNLSPKAKETLRNLAIQQINTTLASDKTYQANMRSLMSKGDVPAIVKFIKANIDIVRGGAIREVWIEPTAATPKPAPKPTVNGQQKTSVNNSALQLPTKPNISDLDLDRDPDRMLFMTGRGYLKAGPNKGRLVTWKKPS